MLRPEHSKADLEVREQIKTADTVAETESQMQTCF